MALSLETDPAHRLEFPQKRILAFMKYDDRAASTRQRLLQYLPYLEQQNIHFDVLALLDNEYVANISRKSAFVGPRTMQAYLRRGLRAYPGARI